MMPLLLLVSLYEFRQFLQIVLWIAVPATLIAIGLTIFFHYRRKKKQEGLELAFHDENSWSEKLLKNPASSSLVQAVASDHPEGLPDWLASANPDNTPLLKKYEHEVRRYRENYALLEQDFRELEDKYAELRNKAYRTDKEADITLVAQLQQDIKAYKEKIDRLQQAAVESNTTDEESLLSLQATIQQLQEDLRLQQEEKGRHAAEIAQLEQLLKNMEQSVSTARDEAAPIQQYHSQLIEDQSVQTLQQLLAQTEAERKALKEKLAEQEYLPDVLEEKRVHIDFLQRQLEQRIKNYHVLEQQAGESATQLQQLQATVNGFDQQIQRLTGELQVQQQQAAEWQSTLEHSREEGQQRQQIILAKTGHIEQLEHNVQELQQQQGILQTEIADQQDAMRTLQEHLVVEQQKATALETKLELSSQLLLRIYAELAKTLGHRVLVNAEQAEIAVNTAAEKGEVLQLQTSL
jgi:chromosome segregation ATPase